MDFSLIAAPGEHLHAVEKAIQEGFESGSFGSLGEPVTNLRNGDRREGGYLILVEGQQSGALAARDRPLAM